MKLNIFVFLFFLSIMAIALDVNAQTISTIAGLPGSGMSSGDGGLAVFANTPRTSCGATDHMGNYYFIEDAGAPRIRQISPTGIITTVAGNGVYGYSGDGGPATNASIHNSFFDVDAEGNIYIADLDRLRKVDVATGIIHTIAGNGTTTSTGDGGPATAATIAALDVCVDGYGNLFVSENAGGTRKIDTFGIITTVAHVNAHGMCFDRTGHLCMGGVTRIYRLDTASGLIDTIAGTGIAYYNGDEIAADTANIYLYDLTIDRIGNLYLADRTFHRIRMIDTFGIIHTVAGNGIYGFSGDGGPATAARIYNPEGIAVDVCGNLYIADKSNNRIRKVSYPPMLTTPSIALTGAPSVPVGSAATVTATVTNAGSSYLIHWMNHGIEFATTTLPAVTYTKPPGTDTITARVVPTGYGCWDSATSAGHIVAVDALHSPAPAGASFRIYPNPAGNILYIDALQEEANYTLSTVVGAVVQVGAVQRGGNIISLLGIAPGVYMLHVQPQSGAKAVYKIVKE